MRPNMHTYGTIRQKITLIQYDFHSNPPKNIFFIYFVVGARCYLRKFIYVCILCCVHFELTNKKKVSEIICRVCETRKPKRATAAAALPPTTKEINKKICANWMLLKLCISMYVYVCVTFFHQMYNTDRFCTYSLLLVPLLADISNFSQCSRAQLFFYFSYFSPSVHFPFFNIVIKSFTAHAPS